MSRTLLRTRNVLKAWALLVGLCAFLGIVPLVTGNYRLLSIFLFCALLLAGAGYFYADRIALGMVSARELQRGEFPVLHSTVERLAAVAGIPKPRLYLLRDGYVLIQSAVAVLAGAIIELSRIGGFLQRALLFALGPFAAALVHLLLSPKREFLADAAAAQLCESPHGLADALIRLEQTSELVDFQGSPATEPLYTINPFEEEGLAALFVTHPPVGERVARLRALDPAWRERLRAA